MTAPDPFSARRHPQLDERVALLGREQQGDDADDEDGEDGAAAAARVGELPHHRNNQGDGAMFAKVVPKRHHRDGHRGAVDDRNRIFAKGFRIRSCLLQGRLLRRSSRRILRRGRRLGVALTRERGQLVHRVGRLQGARGARARAHHQRLGARAPRAVPHSRQKIAVVTPVAAKNTLSPRTRSSIVEHPGGS